MDPNESPSLDGLREILLNLPATGGSGFEGLIASCLAAFTGRTFRLAKSGLQFGLDASTRIHSPSQWRRSGTRTHSRLLALRQPYDISMVVVRCCGSMV